MAIFSNGSSSSGSWMLSLKVLLASTCVVSTAVLLNLLLPGITHFVTSELPSIYNLFLTCLRPPYLYILVNCIIISIVASSKLHHNHHHMPEDYDVNQADAALSASAELVAVRGTGETLKEVSPEGVRDVQCDVYSRVHDAPRMAKVAEAEVYGEVATTVAGDGGDESAVTKPSSAPERTDSSDFKFWNSEEPEREKPPASARFGQRRTAKPSSEFGRAPALGVSRTKRHETLESTWKTITEGRAMPLTRHLKKSDTWDTHARRDHNSDSCSSPPVAVAMKKSETFTTSRPSPSPSPSPNRNSPSSAAASVSEGSGKLLRREPSLGQEELNRRVEAFINKFNEQMRLQRQESLNQFQETINRGIS